MEKEDIILTLTITVSLWTIFAIMDALFQKHDNTPFFEKNFLTKMLRGYKKTKWIAVGSVIFLLLFSYIVTYHAPV